MPNILRRIKNWVRFQHYQDGKRKPEWIKLYRNLLDDIEWHNLEPVAAKTLVNLWLLASENGGTLPPLKVIAFRLRIPERQISAILAQLPHWIDGDASDMLADRYQSDSPEEEREENKKENNKEKEKESRASALPSDWRPENLLPSERSEFEKFTDHFRANGKRMKDWAAAWRNWKRRAPEFSARGSPRGPMPSRTQVAIGKLMEGYADGMESRQGNGTNGGGQAARQLPAASPGSRDLRGATDRPLCGSTRSLGNDNANPGGHFRRVQISAIGGGGEGVADETDGADHVFCPKRSA